MFERLKSYSESLIKDSEAISEDRKILLNELAIYIKETLTTKKEVQLVFICTHNSRRSHMTQIWAQTAAFYYGIPNIYTYSGGTQKTAFNSSAVKALNKVGFKISVIKEGKNPKYQVRWAKKATPLICYSKIYTHKKNPGEGFVAIMTCSDADEACPVVIGAHYRTSIKYDDPKVFDGTDRQEEGYQERSAQIGTEMFYLFRQVSKLIKA